MYFRASNGPLSNDDSNNHQLSEFPSCSLFFKKSTPRTWLEETRTNLCGRPMHRFGSDFRSARYVPGRLTANKRNPGVLCTFQSALKAERREGEAAKVHR